MVLINKDNLSTTSANLPSILRSPLARLRANRRPSPKPFTNKKYAELAKIWTKIKYWTAKAICLFPGQPDTLAETLYMWQFWDHLQCLLRKSRNHFPKSFIVLYAPSLTININVTNSLCWTLRDYQKCCSSLYSSLHVVRPRRPKFQLNTNHHFVIDLINTCCISKTFNATFSVQCMAWTLLQ